MTTRGVLAALMCALTWTFALPTAQGQGLTYEGTMTDLGGAPLDETVSMRFALFTAAQGGEVVWEETRQVLVEQGSFSVVLGQTVALPTDPPQGLFLEVSVGEDVQTPRTPVTGALYAARAQVADDVPGRDITPRTVAIDGFGPVIDAEGRWLGRLADQDTDGDGFSDIVELVLGTDPDDSALSPLDGDDDGVADALQARPGPEGEDGSSCSVSREGPTVTISCEDGTEASFTESGGGGAQLWSFIGLTPEPLQEGGLVIFNNACHAAFEGSRLCTTLEFVRTVAPPPFEGNAFVTPVPVANSDGSYILDATGVYVRRSQLAEITDEGVLLNNFTNTPRPAACCRN